MARLSKNNSSLWGSNPPSPSQRNKEKFYNYYRAGLLDESKITNEGWKSLYEHELEKGYSSSDDIPSNIASKYGIDTSIGRSNQMDFGLDDSSIEPVIETEQQESKGILSRVLDFFKQDDKPKDSIGAVNPTINLEALQPTTDMSTFKMPSFNQDLYNKGIEAKFGGVDSAAKRVEDDPLLMALNGKINPNFIGEQTKHVTNLYNHKNFNIQRQEQDQLNDSGLANPFLSDGTINPYGDIAIPQKKPSSSPQPFLPDGSLNPAGSIINDPASESKLKAGIFQAYREFIGRNAQVNNQKILEDMAPAANAGVNRDMFQKLQADKEYWTEERMFNAFLGKTSDAEMTQGESIARAVGGFAGNLGKLLTFSAVLGPATTTKGMLAKNAGLGALSGAESSYSRGEEPEEIVKDAIIGAGSFLIGEAAGIGVTNKLTSQLVHTYKTNPQWATHLNALVRSARGVTDGSVGTLTQIGLSNALGRETELGLKDAIQSGVIMGIVNGVTSYIPWEQLNINRREIKDFNIKVDEINDGALKSNGYIKLSEVEGVNASNPYINDIYLNPNTKDIVVSAARDGAFLVPKSMVDEALDEQTLSMIRNIESTPIRQSVDLTQQVDYIDKAKNPKQYNNVLNKFMENQGYKLQTENGQSVYAKYNKVSDIEGSWETMPISRAEQMFDNEYFTRYQNTQGARVETGPRTQKGVVGSFDDSYEVNRVAMDSTGRQWIKDMQDQGYTEYKPGVWVKEVDGQIVDIVPEFTVGKNGKAIPVFNIEDSNAPKTSRVGTKGFTVETYEVDGKSTKQDNPYVDQGQREWKENIDNVLNNPELVTDRQYKTFIENIETLENGLKYFDEIGEVNKSLDNFVNNKATKNAIDLFKDFMDGQNVPKSQLLNAMRIFNNGYSRLTGMPEVTSKDIKSASRTKADDKVVENVVNDIEETIDSNAVEEIVDSVDSIVDTDNDLVEGVVNEIEEVDNQVIEKEIKVPTSDTQDLTQDLKDDTTTYNETETKAIEDFANSMVDVKKQWAKDDNREMTEEQIKREYGINRIQASELVDAIKNKDFDTLTSRLHSQNTGSKKVFSTVTGLSTKNQKEVEASIRSLDSEAYDQWKNNKAEEARLAKEKEKQEVKESKEREKQEAFNEIGNRTITSKNGNMALSDYVEQKYNDGYRLVVMNDYGRREWRKNTGNGSYDTLEYNSYDKEVKEYIREKNKELEAKAIAEDNAREQEEYDKLSDEDKAEIDRLFKFPSNDNVEQGSDTTNSDTVQDESSSAGNYNIGDRVIYESKNKKSIGSILSFYGDTARILMDDSDEPIFISLSLLAKADAGQAYPGEIEKDSNIDTSNKFNNKEDIQKILKQNSSVNEKKNSIANLKNHKSSISRIISVDNELDIKEGDIWDNKGVATSWVDLNADSNKQFSVEANKGIDYVLTVDGEVEGYQVQYFPKGESDELDELAFDESYEELMRLLGSDGDMENEAEILVPTETKLRIDQILDGRDDVGYIEVRLSVVDEKTSPMPLEDKNISAQSTNQEDDKNAVTDPVEATNDIQAHNIDDTNDTFEQSEGIIESKKPTLSDYGITIEEASTNKGTSIWQAKGNTKPYADIFGKNGLKGMWYGPRKVWGFSKSKYPTMADLENTILEKLPKLESEVVEEGNIPTQATSPTDESIVENDVVESIEEESPSTQTTEPTSNIDSDFMLQDVIENVKEELLEVLSDDRIKDVLDTFDGSGLGYLSNLENNKIQQDFILNGLEGELKNNNLAKRVYNTILDEVRRLNGKGGKEDDNRTNNTVPTDREQSERDELDQVQGPKEERGTGGISESEGGTDISEDRGSEGGTETPDTRFRGDTTERSGDSGNERNVGKIGGNFRITDETTLHEGGKKTRFKNNVAAIRLVKQLDAENRMATLEEQKILAKYVGWGGITEAFYDDDVKWTKEYKELKELLTEEEYRQARESRLNAHYTAKEVIDQMYKAVKRLGFKNGKILEPAVGSGNFFGLLPEEFFNSKLTAVELEPITGKIATYLYPSANVNIMGYEQYKVPNNFFDLIISNVPFGNFKVNDRDYNHLNFTIHNYYFAKSLDKVKEGGIVAFVTSHFTMDSKNKTVREYINEKAELLGAIRLPNDAFSKNAGTQVTTDIIFLRKLKAGESSHNQWTNMSEINGVPVNEYYVQNPDMLLGEMILQKNMYGSDDETALIATVDDISHIFDKAINMLPENVFDVSQSNYVKPVETTIGDYKLGQYDKVGSIVIQDDKAYRVFDDRLELITQNKTVTKNGAKTIEEVPISGKKLDRIKGMIDIKVALRELVDAQMKDLSDTEIRNSLGKLNRIYDGFVKQNGYITDNANKQAFKDDADYARIATLEVYDAKSKKIDKAQIMKERIIFKQKRIEKADNAIDGLSISLNETGTVDINRIAELVRKSTNDVIQDLKGSIYLEPISNTYQTKDEYLSGNVKEKLRIAGSYAEDNLIYEENVEALESVQPEQISAKDIDTKLGQAWIDADIIENFANELLQSKDIKVRYVSLTNEWIVEGKSSDDSLSMVKYGTNRLRAENMLERLLNNQEIKVNVYDGSGDNRTLLRNESRIETTKALEKAKLVVKEFKDFVFKDQERREYLVNKYNKLFNNTVLREFDGSFLTFDGMDHQIKFRKYQENAVARVILGGNTLLAHTVGAGKTFEMIAAAMELKRLGIANKPMFVVPNHLVGQWSKDFYKLYPNANILAATKDDFVKKNREMLFSKISNNTYDAVIVAHSSFGKIPVSKETELEFINIEIADVEAAIIQAKEAEGKGSRVTKQLETTLKNLRTNLERLNDTVQDNVVTFEELGVDYLFVDEAHNFKNLFFYTKMSRIAGVQNSKAKRATDMYMKTRLVSKLHNNKQGVVFATGTPVSNSIAEMFTMQRYLQMPELESVGINHFDAWANMFGETITKPEVDKTGKGFKMKTRFTNYVNVPELKKMFRQFADVITQDDLKKFLKESGTDMKLPELDGGKPITVQAEPSKELEAYIEELVQRSEAVERGLVEPTEDNALKITNDGRVSALDMRLIDNSYADDPGSKLNLSVQNIYKEYVDGNKDKTTQLVFSDLGTPKKQKTEAQKLKDRKIVKANGYETYKWYYDQENEKKYVVIKIDKEAEEVYKLFEDGDETVDALADKNMDSPSNKPYGFDIDLDEYIEKLGDGDEVSFEVKFDIYNDIREKLVNLGVPREEITFIHEANTDLAKEKLFDKVRKGQVRILLGSTAKMGEGMNVQQRLIALHHLDAPWKPSAIEQRNGRIVRFGNMHNKVRVYQYVTKGSFDAYLWQMLERKASFISTIMNDDYNTRSAKDSFDPVVLNASEVKALASSDPRIIEKFEVDKEIEDLETLKRSHRAEQYDIQDKLAARKRVLDKEQSTITAYENDIKKVVDVSGDNFQMKVQGHSYQHRNEAGEAILKVFENMEKEDKRDNIGIFSNFNISIERSKGIKYLKLQGDRVYSNATASNTPAGIINALTNILKHPQVELERYNKQLEVIRQEVSNLQSQLGKEFEREEELEKLLQRQAQLDSELSLDKTPDSPKGIEEDQTAKTSLSKAKEVKSSIPNESTIEKPTRQKVKKIKPISDIIKGIEQDFKVSISSKRFRAKQNVAGQFQTHSESIRVRKDNDINTVAHELGHYFDKKYDLVQKFKSYISTMEEGLSLSDEYKENEIPHEVIAEFIRLYLVSEERAIKLSPEFYDGFIKTLDTKDLKNLNKHREDILNWYAADLHAKGQSTIRSHTEKKKIPWDNKSLNFEMEIFDDLAPIRRLAELVEQTTGKKLDFKEHPYVLAMMSRKAGMMAKSQIVYAQTDAEGNIIGESFVEVLKDISKEDRKAFDDYLKVSHAITLNDFGKQVYSDDFKIEDLELSKATYELEYPKFAETAEKVYSWWNRFVEEWVVKQGFLDAETWNKLREDYPTYVPNFRVRDEENYSGKAKKGFGNQRSPIKRMRGSARDTYSVIESLVLYTDKIVKTQKRNEVGLAVHDLYQTTEGLGQVLTKITSEHQMHKYNAQDLKATLSARLMEDYIDSLSPSDKQMADSLMESGDYTALVEMLTNKGFAGIEIVDETIDNVITFFTPRMFSTDSSVYTIIDKKGKTHFYEVHDPLFLEAMLNLGDKSMDKVTRMIGATKRVFTTLTTGSNPIFGVTSNIWRDTPEAYAYGSYKDPFSFGLALAKSMKNVFTKDDKAIGYYSMGGGMSSPISENRALMTEMLNTLFPDMKRSGVKNMANFIIGSVEQFNDTIETGPRLTEYNKILEVYGNTYEGRLRAMYESNELTTNFLRHGRIQYTILGQGVPFLNAGLQGLYKLKQEFGGKGPGRDDLTGDGGKKRDKKRMMSILIKVLTSITIFEILQMMAYEEDEEYKKLADYIKDGYWLIKYEDGKWARIPKPRALGTLFGTMFRRGYLSLYEGDPEAWNNFRDTFVNTFLPPNPLTDNIAAGVIGVGRNKTWSGSPIVPARLQNLPPLEQYDTSTSEIAKAVTQVLNKIAGVETSPKNIDYLIQQYTGIIGQVLLPSTTNNKSLGDSLKQKVTTDVAYSNSQTNEFYETKEKLDKAYTLYNQKGKVTKDFDPVLRYRYNQVSKDLSDLWGQINAIKEDPNLSQEERRDQERVLRLEIMKLTDSENLKPTAYDEFKVIYNRGQDLTSEAKEEYEATKTTPTLSKEEETLLRLYNVPVQDKKSQLSLVNSQLLQISKRRKQVESVNTISEAQKKAALKKLDDTEKTLTDSFMANYNKTIGIEISKYFK